MTVTSRLTDRKTKKDKRECRWTSGGGSKIRSQVEGLKERGSNTYEISVGCITKTESR